MSIAAGNENLPRTDQQSRANAEDAQAYRDMMATVDTSRYGSNKLARDQQANGVHHALHRAVPEHVAELPGALNKTLANLRDVVEARVSTVGNAAEKIAGILENDRTYPVARSKDADDALADANSTLDAQAKVFEATYEAAGHDLLAAARPEMAQGDESSARQDARTLLDQSQTPGEAVKRVQNYVRENEDSLAALISGPWLKTYFTGRGWQGEYDTFAEVAIRATVADTARYSGNRTRRAAGEALANLHHYKAGFDVTKSMPGTMDPRKKR